MSVWAERVDIALGSPWDSRAWELYDHSGDIAGFFKKAMGKIVKVVKKVAAPLNKVHKALWKPTKKLLSKIPGFKGVYKFWKKNWKWVAIAAAVVITIYTMGAAGPIIGYLKAGFAACKAAVLAAGKAVVGLFTAGGAAAGGGAAATTATTATTAATAATAATTATTAATAGTSLFTAQNAMLAATAAQKLLAGKKCSELSQPEIQAMADADAAGVMPMHPELAQNLGLKGTGAKTPAQDPFPGVAVGEMVDLDGDGVAETPIQSKTAAGLPGVGGASSSTPSWLIPAGIGALLLVVAL